MSVSVRWVGVTFSFQIRSFGLVMKLPTVEGRLIGVRSRWPASLPLPSTVPVITVFCRLVLDQRTSERMLFRSDCYRSIYRTNNLVPLCWTLCLLTESGSKLGVPYEESSALLAGCAHCRLKQAGTSYSAWFTHYPQSEDALTKSGRVVFVRMRADMCQV